MVLSKHRLPTVALRQGWSERRPEKVDEARWPVIATSTMAPPIRVADPDVSDSLSQTRTGTSGVSGVVMNAVSRGG